MKWIPYNYQAHAFSHIIQNRNCGLFLDMGLGKTVTTLTALNRLIYQDVEVERALVIAPKNVTKTVWKQEAAKWDHLKHMKINIIGGWMTENQRKKALREKADVYVINVNMIVWLVKLFQSRWPFRVVVLDESSLFKNPNTQRFKALKMVLPRITRMVELTGTPAPNSLIDLWGPMFLLDKGERLEKTITGYRERYFAPEKQDGYVVHSYRLRKDSKEIIYEKISDICISMKAEDYLDMPELIENDIHVEMDDKIWAKYEEFEEQSVLEIADQEITALNAAALTNKLLQFCNGAIYYEAVGEDGKLSRKWEEMHTEKLDALEEIVEESFGKPILVFYSFQHDLARIQKRFPQAVLFKGEKELDMWNRGEIPMMVCHPASAGHGLNFQYGGNIMVWFGLSYSLERYLQAVARLWRQGQKETVILHRIIMKGGMDEAVIKALKRKEAGQNELLEAVKAIVDKHINKRTLRPLQ